MLQSQLFTKTTKEPPQDETSRNAQLLIRAGFVDKVFAGVYTLLPLGLRVVKKIEQIIREEMNSVGGQEVYMPALHPVANYEKTDRLDIDVLFHTELQNKSKLVLGQSHEEIITPLMQKYIISYKDLPKSVYQFQAKFRNELRAKSGIMRGREFIMKDLYSFHASAEDLGEYYKVLQKAYFKVFKRAGILDKTYLTFASGGSFSKYSHEFQTLSDAGEDIIHICEKCNLAINKEIIEEQNNCPNCKNEDLKIKKSIETGNIFKLKTRFSNAFDMRYGDKDGREKEVYMGCYGIGLTRLMGTVVEIFNDESGIIWPDELSPFDVHLVGFNTEDDVIKNQVDGIYNKIKDLGYDVLYDDRASMRPGEKLADADLIGIGTRIIASKRSLKDKTLEIKRRNSKEVEFVKIDDLENILKK